MHIQTDFGGNSLETRDMLKQCPPHIVSLWPQIGDGQDIKV